MPDLYPFKTKFEPLFLPGHTVRAHMSEGSKDLFIRAVGALGSHRHDFGAITSASSLTAQEDTHLEMNDGELAQYRFVPSDNFEVEFSNPATTRQLRTRGAGTTVGTNFRIRPWADDPNLPESLREFLFAASEFWVFEQTTPRFDLYAITGGPAVQGYLEFFGYRYSVWTFAQAKENGIQPPERGLFDLWLNSWPSG